MSDLGKTLQHNDHFKQYNIKLGLSPIHRYGVYATKDIVPKEIIEECPAILFQPFLIENREEISDRQFRWDDNTCALILGYGCLYNHSEKPNATYYIDRDKQLMKFIALRPILMGEEIFINYGKMWQPFFNKPSITPTEQQEEKNDNGALKFFILILVLLILSQFFPIH